MFFPTGNVKASSPVFRVGPFTKLKLFAPVVVALLLNVSKLVALLKLIQSEQQSQIPSSRVFF